MAYTFKHGDRPLEGMTIQRAVGRGGFGEVYYALTDSGKQVALKYLRENPEIELRGIAHVMNLKSPHLITIYDVRKGNEGEPFVVMEYIGGPSLRELLVAESGGVGPQKAAFFLCGIAKGLSYLHERGIVHRDLKPGNIFYDDGYVKIGDYGLSKHIAISQHSGQTVSVGTVHYMAPEIGSGNYTKAIDIYALGVILYEMLTGRLPFTGSSMAEILMRHLSDRPDTAGLPEPFAAVVAKALAKDPKDRYQDVNEMVEAVTASLEVSESVASFDPASLAHVTRQPDALDSERTVTTPPRVPPPPPLDAREGGRFERLAAKLQEKTDRLAEKFEEQAAKWEKKLGRKFGARGQTPGPVRAGEPAGGRGRFSQIMVLLAVTLAVSVGLMIVSGRAGPEAVFALALYLIGGTVGALVAHFGLLRHSPIRSSFLSRIVYAGVGALGMAGGMAAGDNVSDSFMLLIVPAAVVMGLCDWNRRIERGQRRQINGEDAVMPAIVGLVVGGMANANAVVAAGLCATLSMLTQAAAAMWPLEAQAQRGAPLPGPARKLRFGQMRARIIRSVSSLRQNVPGGLGGGAARGGVPNPGAPGAVPGRAVAVAISLSPECPCPEETSGAGASAGAPSVAGRGHGGPVNPRWKFLWGMLSAAAFLLTLGCFIFLVAGNIRDRDEEAGLLFGILAGVAWQPFLISKLVQRRRAPVWRGTLRMLLVSAGLCLAGGMISLLAFQHLHDEEFAGAIFGLVVGGLAALICLCVPGSKMLAAGPAMPDAEPPTPSPSSIVPSTLMSAAAPSFVGRTANAGLSLLGKALLIISLLSAIGYSDFSKREHSPFVIRDTVWEKNEEGVRVPVVRAEPIPRAAVLGLLAAACLLLILARRHDPAGHILRGFLGCGFGVAAAAFALGPAYHSLSYFFSDEWQKVSPGALAVTFGFAFSAIVLLFWPKTRADKPIVL